MLAALHGLSGVTCGERLFTVFTDHEEVRESVLTYRRSCPCEWSAVKQNQNVKKVFFYKLQFAVMKSMQLQTLTLGGSILHFEHRILAPQ